MMDEQEQATEFTLDALAMASRKYPLQPHAITFAALAFANRSMHNGAKQLAESVADGTTRSDYTLKEVWGEVDREALKNYLNEMLELLA